MRDTGWLEAAVKRTECCESAMRAVQGKAGLAGGAGFPFPGRWDPIIRQTRTPPPGFHSPSVYHMALSSWAPLTDNERRQPVQLQAKHSTFYRPKHVSGKLTVSIQFCSLFKRPITMPSFSLGTFFCSYCALDPDKIKILLTCSLFWIQGNYIQLIG